MSNPESNELVDELADEFLTRYRAGERPSLAEYMSRFPELSEQIREVFPTLVVMERFGSAGVESAPDGSVDIPEEIGDYRILRRIGAGGMGVVYEAVQKTLGRHVALKVLRATAERSEEHLERFRREARAAAQLHHSNIVPVFEVGDHEGIHYYAMQYIHGHGLDEVVIELRRLRSGDGDPDGSHLLSHRLARSLQGGVGPVEKPFDSKGKNSTAVGIDTDRIATARHQSFYANVARIGMQTAGALQHAHDNGVLHRDIKPSNVLLDTQGAAWITDFGLAKSEENEELTETGDIVGTLRYLSPERLQRQCDRRSEVYSLGLTLYELVTLRPAFSAEARVDVLSQIRDAHPDPPRQIDTRMPRDLETIILKAIDKEPHRRYQTAAELGADLLRFLNFEPIRARPITPVQRVAKWARRHPAVSSLLGAICIVTLLGLTLVLWQWQRAEGALETTGKALKEKKASLITTAKALREKKAALAKTAEALREEKQQAYALGVALAYSEWSANNVGQALRRLERCPPELRGWEWHFLKRRCHQYVANLKHPGGLTLTSAAFDPAGKLVAAVNHTGDTVLWNWRTAKLIHRVNAENRTKYFLARVNLPQIRFAANGKKFLWVGESLLAHSWEVKTGKCLPVGRLNLGRRPSFGCLNLSPDATKLVIGYSQATAKLWEVAGARALFSLYDAVLRGMLGTSVKSITQSNDGKYAAMFAVTGVNGGEVVLWDLTKRTVLHRFATKSQLHRSMVNWEMAFSPDNSLLAFPGRNHAIEVWDWQNGERAHTFTGHGEPVVSLAFSPDGRLLASASHDQSVRIWDCQSGQLARILRGHTNRASCVRFSADGLHVLTAGHDGTIKVWNVHDVPETLYVGPANHFTRGRVSPDGNWLAHIESLRTNDFLQLLRLVDLKTGKDRIITREHLATLITQFQFVPDSSKLLTAYANGTVKVWDVKSGNVLASFRTRDPVLDIGFSADGKKAAFRTVTGIAVYDATKGRPIRFIQKRGIRAFVFNRDANRIFYSTGTVIESTDISQPETPPAKFSETAAAINHLILDGRGNRLAAALDNGKIDVWNVKSGMLLHSLSGHGAAVKHIAFHSHQQRLATLGDDRTVRIWDLDRGQELLVVREVTDQAERLTFSSDGKQLLIVDQNGNVRRFDGGEGRQDSFQR